MAEAMKYFKDFCVNCSVYSWKQPSDGGRLLRRCSRCKFLSYCSEECQQEHWVKVQKHHCKYLAKKKEMRNNRHDPVSCPGCIKQAEIGLPEMSKIDNPYLGCPWTMNNVPLLPKPDHCNVGEDDAVPLPFKLEEMSGQWHSMAEQTASIMNKLLYKMEVTKHPASTIVPVASSLLTKQANKLRQVIWLSYIHEVPTSLGRTIESTIQPIVAEIGMVAADIDKELSVHRYHDQTVFRPWDTFRLLLGILHQYSCDVLRQDAVRLGLPGIPEDFKQLMMTSDQFNDMWRKVLASMDGNLVPFKDLFKTLCDGDLNKVCFGCSKDILVSDVGAFYWVPFIYQGGFIQAYLCGGVKCYNRIGAIDNQLVVTLGKACSVALENLCDYCFLVSSGKVHRCTRCLSKYYCGVQCRDEDWREVHKLVCKGGQERKAKDGQEERKEKGIKKFEDYVNFLSLSF